MILRLENAGKTFGGPQPLEAVSGVSLHVESGDFVSIVGPSGCGKSTLFNLIAGIEDLTSGIIEVKDQSEPDGRRKLTGYMFQEDLLFPWRSVIANAALGLEVAGHYGVKESRRRALELLPRFGLDGFENRYPHELSGGMRQRVALLRTLLLQRPMLLLDEPFAALDALTRRELQVWLRETWSLGSEAALLVTHDVREAVFLSSRVYVMSPRPGRIIAEIAVCEAGELPPNLARQAQAEKEVLLAMGIEVSPRDA